MVPIVGFFRLGVLVLDFLFRLNMPVYKTSVLLHYNYYFYFIYFLVFIEAVALVTVATKADI